MPQLLGRVYHRPQPQSATAFGPAVYNDLLVIPRADLPSGSGSGKDYAVIVFATLGPVFSNGGTSADIVTRIGLRYPGNQEIPRTWSNFYHPTCGLFARGIPGSELSHPVCIVVYLRDFPTTHDLHLSMQHIGPTPQQCATSVQDITALLIDCTRMGGARLGNGWNGDHLRVSEIAPHSGSYSVPVTWSGMTSGKLFVAAAHQFYTASSANLSVSAAWSMRYSKRDIFSDRQDLVCMGSWSAGISDPVSFASSGAVSNGGWAVTLDLDGLDNEAASANEAIDANGIGSLPGQVAVAREVGFGTTRATGELVQLARATIDFADAGRVPVAVITHALQNGWGISGTRAQDRTALWGAITDRLPAHAAAATPFGYSAPAGGAIFSVDRYAAPGLAGTNVVSQSTQVQTCQFSLSDFGPIAADPPISFVTLELAPDYEADLDALPDIAAPMRAVSPFDDQTEGRRMLTAGQYEIRHGGPSRERLVVPVVGESLTLADVEALRVQADTAAAFKATLDDGVVRAWRFVPGSLQWSESAAGIVTVSATLIEHIYLAP